MVCLPEVSDSLFYECVRLAVASNAEFVPPEGSQGFLYIRPVLFGAGPMLALAPPNEFVLAVYVAPGAPYHGDLALDAVVLEDFDRAAPRGTGSGKLGGNYAPVWPHALKAKQSGFQMTLHLDSETRSLVEEFSTSGFLGVDQDRTIYVPNTPCAIRSITSDSLTTIAERAGWTVRREKVCNSDKKY
jgi:branched-chain amino acid aminotransferase